MAPRVALVTDSTADLPAEEAARLQVQVVPAILVLGEESYRDGEGLTRQAFYERLPGLRTPPTTAAPSPQAFAQAYERALAAGAEHVVSVHVSAALSGMVNAASQGAKDFEGRVTVVDSRQVSMGLGLQVIEAAEAAAAGGTAAEVLATLEKARRRVRLFAMLDTLEYLRRSGRVGWLQASLGGLLQVRLLVEVVEGEVRRLAQERTRRRGVARLLAEVQRQGAAERLAVLHTRAEAEARELAARLAEAGYPSDAYVVEATPIIGAHVGPGALGVATLLAEA